MFILIVLCVSHFSFSDVVFIFIVSVYFLSDSEDVTTVFSDTVFIFCCLDISKGT